MALQKSAHFFTRHFVDFFGRRQYFDEPMLAAGLVEFRDGSSFEVDAQHLGHAVRADHHVGQLFSQRGAGGLHIHPADAAGELAHELLGHVQRLARLAGFDLVDDLVMNATEGAMGILSDDLDVEEKTIQVKRDGVMTPLVVQALAGLIGSRGKLAILKEVVDETKKSDATGLYEATGGTKEQNTIIKVFGESGHTINELVNEIEQPVFQAEWLDAWKGKTKTSTKGAGKTAVAGKPAVTGAVVKKASLFKK